MATQSLAVPRIHVEHQRQVFAKRKKLLKFVGSQCIAHVPTGAQNRIDPMQGT